MKSVLYFLPFFIIACQPSPACYDSVDPFIGTDASHIISMWRSEACTYPGAVAPHGLVQISPETSDRNDFLQGYYYSHDTIRRFSLAEHFSGWPDGSKGQGVLMPFSSTENSSLSALKSSFSHSKEVAQPGYYQVYLHDLQIDCRFTALTRSIIGILDYQDQEVKGLLVSGFKDYLHPTEKTLILQLQANSKYIGETSDIIYIHFEFQEPFMISEEGKTLILQFPSTSKDLKFKYGGSYVSAENARLNLEHEIPGWNFNVVRQQSRKLWEQELNIVEVEGKDEDDKTMLYTALYHASLLPINATDINRGFPGMEDNDPLEDDETHYIYFTPWDAFRTKHPLLNLINPKKERDFLRSMLRYYQTTGQLPEPQVMTGVHVSSLFADALAKGNYDFNVDLAYQGLKEMLLQKPYFRKSLNSFNMLGYIPFPEHYATTATLEFSFNYWALAQVARYAGDEKTASLCEQLSLNYRNNYHPQKRFMLTKNHEGSWSDASLYAEADKWNMSWLAPHNTQDLINLMGGSDAFSEHLNDNFASGHFILDNECPMNFPFLFPHAGKPWLSMKWKDQIVNEYFNTSHGGIPGNDDWGSMSSWYLCAALGLFPASPGTDELILCSPVFDKVTIRQPHGEKLVIRANHLSKDNIYIRSCELSGQPYNNSFIKQTELFESGEISFDMAPNPNKDWGQGYLPYSLTTSTPDFTITDLMANKVKVRSNELFLISVSVANRGSTGSYELQLLDQGTMIHSQWVLVNQDDVASIDIPTRLFSGEIHEISLENHTIKIDVEATKLDGKSAFTFSTPEIKPLIHQRDSITFTCEVKNISGFPETCTPKIRVDNHVIETLGAFTIQPGESRKIKHTLDKTLQKGFHSLSIDNSQLARFKIYNTADESLVLHYDFQKQGHQIKDHSGFDNHGIITGDIEFVEGLSGAGIRIIDGHIEVPRSQTLDISNNEMTIICRYKVGNEKDMGSILTQGTHNMIKMSGKWQIKLAIGGWGRGQCFFNSTPNPTEAGDPAWLNEWIEVAGVRKKGNLSLFVDGDLKYQLFPKGEIFNTDFGWRIGDNAERSGERYPEGVIDEVWIFAKALSTEQIQKVLENNLCNKSNTLKVLMRNTRAR